MFRRARSAAQSFAPLAIAGAALVLAPASSEASPFARQVEELASKATTATFTAELLQSGSAKAGGESALDVMVTITDSKYHVNEQYPIKFKLDAAPEGVTFPEAIIKKEQFKVEPLKATARVPFTAAKPGKKTVSGTLHVGVCSNSDGKCLMEKLPLSLEVDVK